MKEKILKIFFDKNGRSINKRFSKKWISENFNEFFELEPKIENLSEKIFCLKNDMKEQPKCLCGKPRQYKSGRYLKYCSNECSKNNRGKDTVKAIKTRFGTNSYFSTKDFKRKKEETCLTRYGEKHYTNRDKFKKTLLGKYGVENPSQSTLIPRNSFKWKDYILPSGKVVKLQGYENLLFDELLKEYSEEEIICSRKKFLKLNI